MVYVDDADQMLGLLDNPGQLQSRYMEPRSERVVAAFWNRKVFAKKRQCLESFGVPWCVTEECWYSSPTECSYAMWVNPFRGACK